MVTTVAPGDSVLLSYTSCSSCPACEEHKPSACLQWQAMNFGRVRGGGFVDAAGAKMAGKGDALVHGAFFGQSSMANMAIVSEASVSSDTDLVALAPLGCGLMTGSGAVINRLRPTPDSSIAIYGLGAVGMSGILAPAHLKVSTIVAIDVVPSRLAIAKEFGATHTLDARAPDVLAQLRPGVKPDFAIFEHVCTAKIYSAVLMGCCYPREFVPFLIDLHRQGKFPIEKISKKYKVDQFQEAILAMETGEVIKPIIVFD
ncbi:hypothetical protein NliqN6_1361 [Naganishia liquefaciens]|uniref:Zinc-binding dehydrogenase n=1 Tax=Naganishia liquefaciens TaxID=104408 RepID=A0A8H3TQ71_9TREE|nr:hypothetical protein NliqN6_1361 [Naganishia liquefaciens]